MSVTAYGLATGDYEPQADFRASRDAQGAYTASNSYKMLFDTWEQGVKDTFLKGTPITALFDALPAFWVFLELESFDVERSAGGIATVYCHYTGFNASEYESDREVTYILSGTRVETSILQHPLLNAEIDPEAANVAFTTLKNGLDGTHSIDIDKTFSTTEVHVQDLSDWSKPAQILTDPVVIKWVRVIFQQGVRTYKAPTLQWTRETSNLSGINDSDLDFLGLTEYKGAARPPGNPPMPFHGYREWMKISVNDVRTAGSSSNSETWELSPPGGFHRFPGQGKNENGKGIYNYTLPEVD